MATQAEEERVRKIQDEFLVTTGYNFEGYHIERYIDVISAGVVQGTGIFAEFSADVNDLFGLESQSFAGKVSVCREAAMKMLESKAISIGANALLGIDFDMSTLRNNMISIMVTGTAVYISKQQ